MLHSLSHVRPLWLVGLVFGFGLLSSPTSAQAASPKQLLPALTSAQRKALYGFVGDTPVRRNNHYIKTNESRHDLLYSFVKGLRGGHIGIASDQNYTIMAYSQSQYGFLIDYDSDVQDIHWVHRCLILATPQLGQYLKRWSKPQANKSMKLLRKCYAGHKMKKQFYRAFRRYRRTLFKYLSRRAKMPAASRANWLNTSKYYQYIRRMHQTDRIRILYGNLVGDKTLVRIGKAARQMGLPIRTFYTSNSEEWIRYQAPYRRNINALYVDDKSVMLRTLWIKIFQPRATDLWQYNVQKLKQFQRFLRKQDSWVGGLDPLMRLSHQWGVTLIGFPPNYTP